jgi:hypothetical protein
LVVNAESEVNDQGEQDGREYLQNQVGKHSAEEVRTRTVHFVHQLPLEHWHLHRHLNHHDHDGREKQTVRQQKRQTFEVLDHVALGRWGVWRWIATVKETSKVDQSSYGHVNK